MSFLDDEPGPLVAYVVFSFIEHFIIIFTVFFAKSGLYQNNFKNVKRMSKMLFIAFIFYSLYLFCYIAFAVEYEGVTTTFFPIIGLIIAGGIYVILLGKNQVLTKQSKRLEEILNQKIKRAQGSGFGGCSI